MRIKRKLSLILTLLLLFGFLPQRPAYASNHSIHIYYKSHDINDPYSEYVAAIDPASVNRALRYMSSRGINYIPDGCTITGYIDETYGGYIDGDTSITLVRYYIRLEYAQVYTVSYNTGSTSGTLTIAKGSAIGSNLPSIPARTGYTSKWVDSSGNTVTSSTVINSDISIHAQYTPISYTITYLDANGGTFATKSVAYDQIIPNPDTSNRPTKTGYTFAGWQGVGSSRVTGNMSLQPVFNINHYSVKFMYNSQQIGATQSIAYGGNATPPDMSSYNFGEGLEFRAWSGSYTNVTSDRVITAGTKLKTYSITLNITKPDTSVDTQVIEVKHGYGINVPEIEGYHIDNPLDLTNITSSRTINVAYIQNIYTVKLAYLDGDDNIKYTEVSVPHGGDVTVPDDVNRIGYDLSWDSPLTNITSDRTITAIYNIKKFDVTFNYNGETKVYNNIPYGTTIAPPSEATRFGYDITWDRDMSLPITDTTIINGTYSPTTFNIDFRDDNGNIVCTVPVTYNTPITLPNIVIEKEGYRQSGWLQDGNPYHEGDPVTSDLSFTPNFIQTRTVEFRDYDDTLIATRTVDEGQSVSDPPAPTRPGYDFDGWTKDDIIYDPTTETTGNVTLKAKYTKLYTVTYLDDNNEVFDTKLVREGECAPDLPNPPEKEGHTFKCWDDVTQPVTGVCSVKATYDINKYNVTLRVLDLDGSLKEEVVPTEWMTTVRVPDSLDKPRYGIVWNDSLSNITEDKVISGHYELSKYTVNFVDDEGNLVSEQHDILEGESATEPEPPAKRGYTFTEWRPNFDDVESDLVVTANYRINRYKVRFVDAYDEPISEVQTVEYNQSATLPEELPTLPNCELVAWNPDYCNIYNDNEEDILDIHPVFEEININHVYKDINGNELLNVTLPVSETPVPPTAPQVEGKTFRCWTPTVTSEGYREYQATYDATAYYVTFLDGDGTIIDTQEVSHGSSAIVPTQTPTIEGGTFREWDTDYSNVTSSLIIHPLFDMQQCTVTFLNDDGSTFATKTVDYGSEVEPPATNPTCSGKYFGGWVESLSCITEDVQIHPVFTEGRHLCTVTFKDTLGTILKTERVNYGEDATPPTVTDRDDGKHFKRWAGTYTDVTADTVIVGLYEDDYVVTFLDEDGSTVLDTSYVRSGHDAIPPTPPTKEGKVFTSWDRGYTNIQSDWSVKAQYGQATEQFTVTFLDYDGTVLKSTKVNKGESATPPSDPKRSGYKFKSWSESFSNVQSDITTRATYKRKSNDDDDDEEYTVKFVDWDGTVLKRQTVEEGDDADAPTKPTREGYTFLRWDRNYENVKSDITVKAVYVENTDTNNGNTGDDSNGNGGNDSGNGTDKINDGGDTATDYTAPKVESSSNNQDKPIKKQEAVVKFNDSTTALLSGSTISKPVTVRNADKDMVPNLAKTASSNNSASPTKPVETKKVDYSDTYAKLAEMQGNNSGVVKTTFRTNPDKDDVTFIQDDIFSNIPVQDEGGIPSSSSSHKQDKDKTTEGKSGLSLGVKLFIFIGLPLILLAIFLIIIILLKKRREEKEAEEEIERLRKERKQNK